MFIGHFAVALAAKRAAPAVSLGVLLLACQFADILWPTFVLTGLERVEIDPGNTAFTPLNFVSYPYSHSLLALCLWGAGSALVYMAARHSTRLAAAVIGLVVVSHWILDFVTHRPDLPLTISGGPHVGLGLWNSVAGTVVVEAAMLVAGLVLYVGVTRPTDRVGSIGFWAFIAMLAAVYVASCAGPPPPSASAVAWSAQGLWLFVFWAHWVDAHRTA
jgi:hypothetical protein